MKSPLSCLNASANPINPIAVQNIIRNMSSGPKAINAENGITAKPMMTLKTTILKL